MNLLSALLFIGLSITSVAQTVHVVIIDASTHKPVKGVKIKSLHDHDLITFSNDSGYFATNLTHSDTILLEMDFYYPVYMSLSSHRFDSTHVIRLPLTPSAKIYKGSNQFQKMNLQALEYHFTHDQLVDSEAKIIVFQTKDELNVQKKWNDKSFKFASVDIFTRNTKDKNAYMLKQP